MTPSDDVRHIKIAEDLAGEPPEVHPAGRKCQKCGTKLNSYNPGDLCSVCRRGKYVRQALVSRRPSFR